MKNPTLLVMLCAIALSALFAVPARAAEGKKVLYHVVSLKFTPDADPAKVRNAEQVFAGLKEKIPTIVSLNWGTNVSKEKKDKGFTHCFVLTFASEKDRDDYIPHPAHKALGGALTGIIADVMVVDFWAQE